MSYYGQNRQYNGGGGYRGNGGGGGRDGGGGGGGGSWQNNSYNGGGNGGGGGGYNNNFNNDGNRKRGREDEYSQGGPRRRNNEDGNYSHPRRESQGGPTQMYGGPTSQQFKDQIWGLGATQSYRAGVDLPELAKTVESQMGRSPQVVYEAFRVAICELPHKLPHYITLLSLLARAAPTEPKAEVPVPVPSTEKDSQEDAPGGEKPTSLPAKVEMEVVNTGKAIILNLVEACKLYLEQRKWRNVRYCFHLFAGLATLPSPLISSASLTALLGSFSVVLDEPGLRAARGDECARIIVESLLRLGRDGSAGTESLRAAVQVYLEARKLARDLFGDAENAGQFEDRLDTLVSTLVSDYPLLVDILPIVLVDNSRLPPAIAPIDLPLFSVPSEVEADVLATAAPITATSSGLRGDEGVGYEGTRIYYRFFDDDSVPGLYDPNGAVLRSLIHDIIDLYETNRKEAAKLLLELPLWVVAGTFKGTPVEDGEPGPEWVLENLVVESILGSLFSLPGPRLSAAYYEALLNELCRTSPNTIAPALGRCVRRLYGGLGTDVEAGSPIILDPEGIKRFAEWFATHLSNFGFAWSWSDWIPDMQEGSKHPKRVFVARLIELEVRLSYHERVKGTIPEGLFNTGVMTELAPGPEYAFAAADHPHHAASASLLRLMRAKGSVPEVEAELESFKTSLQAEQGVGETEAASVMRDMAIQTILSIGSMSFSHFLNVLERYLSLVHTLTPNSATRLELLRTVAAFWSRNAQFHQIVLTKLLQYRLVDAASVVAWIFSGNADWSNVDTWSCLSIARKAIKARIAGAQVKLALAQREEEATVASRSADAIPEEAAEVISATSQLASVEAELASTTIETVKQFSLLLNSPGIDAEGWENWWITGWFREFCRSASANLVTPAVVEGIAALNLDSDSAVQKILASAQAWQDFS